MVKQSKIDEGLRKLLLLGKVELEEQRICKGGKVPQAAGLPGTQSRSCISCLCSIVVGDRGELLTLGNLRGCWMFVRLVDGDR